MHAYYFSYDFAYASEKTQFQLLHILHPELERKPTCSKVLSTDAGLLRPAHATYPDEVRHVTPKGTS